MTDGKRILPFLFSRKKATAAPARKPDWLDAPSGLRLDVDVRVSAPSDASKTDQSGKD
jgi:hypothetical protein